MNRNGKVLATVLGVIAAVAATSAIWWWATCDRAPVVFMLDCEAEGPVPDWLDSGRDVKFEEQLCIPLIHELIDTGGIDSVAWQVLGSHFRVFLQAKAGVDAKAMQARLAAAVDKSKLRRTGLFGRDQYWIGPRPLLVELAERPEMDPMLPGDSKVIEVRVEESRARILGLTLEDVRTAVAGRLSDGDSSVLVRWLDSQDLEDLGQTLIPLESGQVVPLDQIARFEIFYTGFTRPWITSGEFKKRLSDADAGKVGG